jgi:hypothetical protein
MFLPLLIFAALFSRYQRQCPVTRWLRGAMDIASEGPNWDDPTEALWSSMAPIENAMCVGFSIAMFIHVFIIAKGHTSQRNIDVFLCAVLYPDNHWSIKGCIPTISRTSVGSFQHASTAWRNTPYVVEGFRDQGTGLECLEVPDEIGGSQVGDVPFK